MIIILATPHGALAAQSDVVNAVNQIRLSDPNVPVGTPNPRGLVGNIIDNMFYPTGPKEGKIRPEYLDITTSSVAGTLIDLNSQGTTGYLPKYTGTGITLGDSVISESGGNIGIGTGSPSYPLHINQSGTVVSAIQGSAAATSRLISPSSMWDIKTPADFSTDLAFRDVTNGRSRLNLKTNGDIVMSWDGGVGNVGIGTTSPSYKLDVLGLVRSAGPIWQNGFLMNGQGSATTWRIGACDTIGDSNCSPNSLVIHQDTVATRLAINSSGDVGIGTVTPSYKLDVVGTINASALRLPNGASNWLVLTSDTSGLTSWQATQYPCISGGTGSNNTCYGVSALPTNTSGSSNTAIWKQALLSNTVGSNNTANGTNALFWSTGGSNNTAIGANSAYNNIFRNNNTTIGTNAGYSNISGDDTVAVGTNALYSNNSSGNIAIGYSAGSTLVNGTQNIFIGYNVQPNISTIASNQLNIGNWIYGDNGNIGIGTATPSYKLDVVGTINASALRLPNGSGSGRVLTSDASGNTSWQDLTTGDGAPIGTVTAFNLSVCPAGWSPANGTSGTPDLRGEFIRGLDSGRGVDTGRTLGTAQTDELKSHSHALSSDTARFPGPTNIFMAGDGTAGGTTGGTTQSAGGAETRPRNVALLYCIKTSAIAIAGSTGWSLTGNAGTTAGTNFIGTTDNVDLVFKQNSLEVWRIRDTSNGNVSIGHYTLSSATGIRNAAVGFMALWKNTTGTQNTAMGTSALQETTTGVNNTAFGNQALGYNITGSNTTAVGHGALWQNLASDNTAIGSQALTNNTTGVNNTAVGRLALAWNTTGASNTAIGLQALSWNTTGTNNTAIGSNAQVPSGTADNQVRIGDTAVTYAGVQVAWSVTSDIRWKDKVRDIPYGLSFLKDLRPVDYIRKNNIWDTRETGFIAQEVEQALIKNNYTDQGLLTKSDAGYLELRYNDFIAMLVRAVQEISGSIDTLTARSDVHDTAISELQMSNKKLQSENAALMQRLDAIEKQLQK
jgi:hypothetical protein